MAALLLAVVLTAARPETNFAPDGMHLVESGQRKHAAAMLRALGVSVPSR